MRKCLSGRSGSFEKGILPNEANKSFVLNVGVDKVRRIPPCSKKCSAHFAVTYADANAQWDYVCVNLKTVPKPLGPPAPPCSCFHVSLLKQVMVRLR